MAEDSGIRIVDATETIFFGRPPRDGTLRQWIELAIENRHCEERKALATIEAGGEKVETDLILKPGEHLYRAHAKVLWPELPVEPAARVVVQAGNETAEATVSVGSHRPWVVHVLSDCCSDYTWGPYSDEAAYRADDAALSAAEIALAEETSHLPPDERSAYNFVHARELEFLMEHYPEKAETAFEELRAGRFSVSPFFNNAITSAMGLEELIRQFYFARRLEREHGIPIKYANHQETPTITWMMATILAGCGIPYLVKGIYHMQCPWAERLAQLPLYLWEGPDGSRVLLRRGDHGYAEADFLHRETDLAGINAALHEKILPKREAEDYPFRAVALLGCYGDLSPSHNTMPKAKAASIRSYQSQEWDYPKMVDSSHERFWRAVEAEIAERKIELPVQRGDYGCGWDAWPVSLAKYFAAWRRGQELAVTADKLMAIATVLDPSFHASHSDDLERAWKCLLSLADHAWNGANDGNRALNARLRKNWSETACSLFGEIAESGLEKIASRVDAPGSSLLVFNALPWERTAVAVVSGLDAGEFVVRDSLTGEALPTQSEGKGRVIFEARHVPSVGYRVFGIEEGTPGRGAVTIDDNVIESPFYRASLSPETGAIQSLFDKTRGRELVDSESPYDLGQCVYTVGEKDHVPCSVEISRGATGAVFGEVVVRSRVEELKLKTTVRLYSNLDRVDIAHEVERPVRSVPEQIDFVFPFNIPDPQYRVEAPGCIMTPGELKAGGEQLPGSGQAYTLVRHFVDVFNEAVGVTLSQADSALVQFGHRTQAEDPIEPDRSCATVWCTALGNLINHEEVTHDQAGETGFVFRYSLRGHTGGFDPVRAIRFAWEDNNELLACRVPEGGSGGLSGGLRSFASVSPDTAILTALKVADEGPQAGIVLRLWSLQDAGQVTEAEVDLSGLGGISSVRRVDLLERDGEEIAHDGSKFSLGVRGRGLAAARANISAK